LLSRQGLSCGPVSVRDANRLFTFRLAMELACLAEAVKNAADADLRALDRFREFDGDYESELIIYNRDFHCSLARCSGNTRMARTACDLIEEMERLVRMSVTAARV
jgi:DNA-binding GntR family transcriptional regulator